MGTRIARLGLLALLLAALGPLCAWAAERPVSPTVQELAVKKPETIGPVSALAGMWTFDLPARGEKFQVFNAPVGARQPGGIMNWKYNDANRPGLFPDKNAVISQIQASMGRWSAVCNISFVYQNETAIGFSLPGTFDTTNVIGWDAASMPTPTTTTGLTYIGWDGSNIIGDADIHLNVNYNPPSAFDATVTHEVGHAIGLDHSQFPGHLMSNNPYRNNGNAALDQDDIDGCVSLYGAPGGGPPPPDTQAPSVPIALTAAVVSSSVVNLAWTASTDNVGVTSYKVFQGGTLLGSVAGAGAGINGLAASTLYSFTVSACDAANNCSAQSAAVLAITQAAGPPPDTQAPTVPAGLTATVASSSAINLAWSASTDNVGVTGYKVFQGGTLLGTVASTSAAVTGLSASTMYSFTVSACDAASNCSAQSALVSATTQAAGSPLDTQAPTAPAGLMATVVSSSTINLAWSASTDNVGVTGYKVFQNGTLSGTVSSAGASITSLSASTTYSFTVSACDAASNCSAQSAAVSATTFTVSQVQPTVDYTGAWYDASESGWGLSVVRGQISGVYGIIMYHYNQSLSPTWYWMSGGSFSGNTYSAPITLYSGPFFGGTFNPALVTHPQVGSTTINFTSATTATISYIISGITVTKDITKLDF